MLFFALLLYGSCQGQYGRCFDNKESFLYNAAKESSDNKNDYRI